MSSKHTYKPAGPFDQQYITRVYIPSALFIAAVALVKIQYTPIAIAAAAALAGWQFFNNRTYLRRIYMFLSLIHI